MDCGVNGRYTGDEQQLPIEICGECIVEQGIPFSGESSLVGAKEIIRGLCFYPLTLEIFIQDGILHKVLLQILQTLQQL